eukprot:TRINITY_DN20621_c0_g3_i1.p1 TRINITY_DN20621_c0_g3~~TRINITY_DN20621_c0_g3_i1.p1  ORF type:complete len:354 (+),score=46.12 TRINITY_DN20621_c0_g3_i1:103-1164(+)
MTAEKGGPTFLGLPMKWVSLLMLVAQTVGVVFAMRLSRTSKVDGPRYLNTTAVFFSECMKLVCSFLFLCGERGFTSAQITVRQYVVKNPGEFVKISVPSVLYTVQNNLLFIALSNLSGAVYQVTYQLKILTTAVLSVIILGKALGGTKWSALMMLTVGVTLIQWPRGDPPSPEHASGAAAEDLGNPVIGLIAVLSACMTSGFAGVFLEKLLKQSDASIWMRNIQLALVGSILGLAGCYMTDGAKIRADGFMQGYNNLVWLVIILQAVGGLVVAAVLKYADNLLKCFGNAISICISCLLSAVLLKEFTPDLLFGIGTMFVLVATSVYNLGLPEALMRRLRSTPPSPTNKIAQGP